MAGRATTDAIIKGRCAISVNNPGHPSPPGWARVALTDVAELGTGHTPSRLHPEYWDGDVPWIGIRDAGAHHGRTIHQTSQHVTALGLANSAARLLPKDTVCLSRTASVGYVVKLGKPMATSQDFVTWSCSGALDPDYLVQALLAEGQDIRRFGEGSTHTTIYFPEVKAFHIDLPPLAEQSRIVAKLDGLTTRIARARSELDRASHLAKAVRTTAVESAFARKRRASNTHELPVDGTTIQDLVDEGPSNGWSPPSGADATGALTLKLTATTSGRLRLDSAAVKRIYDTPPETSKFWLQTGDLLIQRANALEHVGATAIYEGPPKTYIYPDLMMRIRVRDPKLTRLLWYYFNSPLVRAYFRGKATGTAGNMPKISGSVVRSLTFPKLSENERELTLERLDAAFARADRLEAEIARATKLLDRLQASILAQAFRGELVPRDPADEPAAALLDRFCAERAATPQAQRSRRAAPAASN